MPATKDEAVVEHRKKPLAGIRSVLRKVFSTSPKSAKTGSNSPATPLKTTRSHDEAQFICDAPPPSAAGQARHQQLQSREEVDDALDNSSREPGRMAVFRKFLTATKNKIKPGNIKVEGDALATQDDEEFENIKQEWQDELDQMSDFLVLKSTEEQREEGVENPVDTAYIEDRDGMPMLKACFDVQYFKPEEVQLSVEDGHLTLFAQSLEEKDVAVFKKTMIRKLEIPRYVDHKMMHCTLSRDRKLLTVEMPFHLPPQKRPVGPAVVPVFNDPDGHRKIRLAFSVGPDFTQDDVSVVLDGERCLVVEASYEAEIGVYGSQVTKRQFCKKFRLPDFIHVIKVDHKLNEEGQLFVDLTLKDDPRFKVKVTTETVDDETTPPEKSRLDSVSISHPASSTAQSKIHEETETETETEIKIIGEIPVDGRPPLPRALKQERLPENEATRNHKDDAEEEEEEEEEEEGGEEEIG